VLRIARSIAKETGNRNLCLAGGVALNCVANGKLLRDGSFDNIWIQPAAGDAGGALGAALAVHYLMLNETRTVDVTGNDMQGSYLGSSFSQSEIEKRLTDLGAVFETLSDAQLINETAKALSDGKAVGWHQGRMEFGPRALGNRSILADPRNSDTQKTLNLKVKFRESFRPFAPSVLSENVSEWFDMNTDSPYMLLVADVKSDKRLTQA
jgi:carbamoyltransferase